ncbi:hypothetical protein PORCRE_1027 [Porphyromonas crevioricanis JCM 15906]|uniref:Uncharacterized protein n=1 Tax=Porphyromonas crevioricanis JCM 15906 TaxID=1305617 RepID=T1CNE3_9PORP|nr:hypothetical protein PORCRE_1027 [Porphyromonas crevioricanis JCM 15906]
MRDRHIRSLRFFYPDFRKNIVLRITKVHPDHLIQWNPAFIHATDEIIHFSTKGSDHCIIHIPQLHLACIVSVVGIFLIKGKEAIQSLSQIRNSSLDTVVEIVDNILARQQFSFDQGELILDVIDIFPHLFLKNILSRVGINPMSFINMDKRQMSLDRQTRIINAFQVLIRAPIIKFSSCTKQTYCLRSHCSANPCCPIQGIFPAQHLPCFILSPGTSTGNEPLQPKKLSVFDLLPCQ